MALTPKLAAKLLRALKDANVESAPQGASSVLNFMLSQLRQLDELSNGYPRNPIAGNVWMDGAALTTVADELADEVTRRELPEHIELAPRIAAGMACKVMSHYPEEIFPRVVRNGRARLALARTDDAAQCFLSVVADFDNLGLVELLDQSPDDLTHADIAILQAFHTAAVQLRELRPNERPALVARADDVARLLERRRAEPA